MKKKILAFSLCMLLVANPCLAASTGVVTVSGGSIATGGLSGGYSQRTESAAITLTMAMLHGLGVSIKLSQDAINAGESAYSFVKGKFYEWVGGSSAEQLNDSQYQDLKSRFEVINGGSNIDPDGNIYFNGTALDMVRRFLNWLDVSDYIHDNSGSGEQPATDTGSINNVSTIYSDRIYSVPYESVFRAVTVGQPSNNTEIGQYTTEKCLWYRAYDEQDRVYLICISISQNNNLYCSQFLNSGRYSGVANLIDNIFNGYKYFYVRGSQINNTTFPQATFINNTDDTRTILTVVQEFLGGGNGDIDAGSGSSEDSDGFNYEGDFDPSVLNNPDGNNLVVQPDLVQGLQENNPNQQINIPVEQYLEALKQLLNQATNPQAVPEPIPAQDVPTLSPVPVEVPADLPLEWPVELPSSPDATPDLPTDNTPVTDPSAPVQPVDALPELTFNLDEYFPFCIPFDVYHLLSKFSADPVTPVFDIGFTEPFTNTNVNFHLDLSPWDSVASAVRTAELGAFIVGLAVASRAIFTRG